MIPKTAQEAPKTAQEAPKAAQDAPETAPKATRTAQEDVLGPRGADLGRLGESRRPLAAMGGPWRTWGAVVTPVLGPKSCVYIYIYMLHIYIYIYIYIPY